MTRQRIDRRQFVRLGATAGAGAFLELCHPPRVQGAMRLPASPSFATRHLVVVLLGNGARRLDLLDERGHAPHQRRMAASGTLFTVDYGERVGPPGFVSSEILSGRDAPAQRPLFPTWSESIRKKTGARASELWMLQGVSFYRGSTWDVKHYSRHPDYGIRYGATSLTASQLFRSGSDVLARELVERSVERALGHSARERARIEAFLDDVVARRLCEPPTTRRPVLERPVPLGDCQSLLLAGHILKAFEPRVVTVQLLGLGDAEAELGGGREGTGFERYRDHLEAVDELIGRMWDEIQADPYLRATTALVVRPDVGRNAEADGRGRLGRSPGNPECHAVWTLALGPDFERGRVVRERVQRRDLAPTLTYLMTGETAEHATGHVRTQLFREAYRMPRYVLPETKAMPRPIDG